MFEACMQSWNKQKGFVSKKMSQQYVLNTPENLRFEPRCEQLPKELTTVKLKS